MAEFIRPAFLSLESCDHLHSLLDNTDRKQDLLVFNGTEKRFGESKLSELSFNSRFESHLISLDDPEYQGTAFYKIDNPSCLPEGFENNNELFYYPTVEVGSRVPYDSLDSSELNFINMLGYWLNISQV